MQTQHATWAPPPNPVPSDDRRSDDWWPPETVSATQLETFVDCPRKWGFRYIEGLKPPKKPSAAAGTRFHKILENYLQHGIAPDVTEEFRVGDRVYHPGRMAYAGLHLLPHPGPDLLIETKFLFDIWGGYIDLAHRREPIARVNDHKTSTDPGKWARTEAELGSELQPLLYADAAMRGSGEKQVHLEWLCFQSRQPFKVVKTARTLSRGEVDFGMGEWKRKADELLYTRTFKNKGLRAVHLPVNTNACSKYGGCDFLPICPVTTEERIRGFYMSEESMAERVRKMAEAKMRGEVVNAATVAAGGPGGASLIPALPTNGVPALPTNGVPTSAPPLPANGVLPLPTPAAQPRRNATEADVPSVEKAWLEAAAKTVKVDLEAIGVSLGIYTDHIAAIVHHYSGGWIVNARAGKINPPEEPATPKLQPETPSTPGAPDAKPSGDAFDAMERPALIKFIEENKLPVEYGKKHASTIRDLIRVAVRDRNTALRLGEPPPLPKPSKQPELPGMQAPAPGAPITPEMLKSEVDKMLQGSAVATQLETTLVKAAEEHAMLVDAKIVENAFAAMPVVPEEAEDAFAGISTVSADGGSFALFVDCVPFRLLGDRQVLTVREAFAPAFERVALQHGCDYTLIDYNKGSAFVCVEIEALQHQRPLGEETVVLLQRAGRDRDFLEVLTRLAGDVVIGS